MKYIKLFESYIEKHYLEQGLTDGKESKVESALRDILVELFDRGMQVQATWPSSDIIVLAFHYPLDDNGSPDDIFKIGDIYEYCQMINDYMKDFWGEESECSYEFEKYNRVWDLTDLQNKDVRFVRMYINKIPMHRKRANY